MFSLLFATLNWHLKMLLLSDELLSKLAKSVLDTPISKESIGWHLGDLEAVTREVRGREADSDDE
jgi:hypothetical protein